MPTFVWNKCPWQILAVNPFYIVSAPLKLGILYLSASVCSINIHLIYLLCSVCSPEWRIYLLFERDKTFYFSAVLCLPPPSLHQAVTSNLLLLSNCRQHHPKITFNASVSFLTPFKRYKLSWQHHPNLLLHLIPTYFYIMQTNKIAPKFAFDRTFQYPWLTFPPGDHVVNGFWHYQININIEFIHVTTFHPTVVMIRLSKLREITKKNQ